MWSVGQAVAVIEVRPARLVAVGIDGGWKSGGVGPVVAGLLDLATGTDRGSLQPDGRGWGPMLSLFVSCRRPDALRGSTLGAVWGAECPADVDQRADLFGGELLVEVGVEGVGQR